MNPQLPALPTIPFVQAAHYQPIDTPPRPIDLIVIHTMEAPGKDGTARWCADYFASGSDGRPASAHYCVDGDTIIHCVQEKDVAYGAPGANHNGLHIEHAGYAAQRSTDWNDTFNVKMLKLSAVLVADIAHRHNIPLRWLTLEEVRAGQRGLCGHRDVTLAFPARHGTHMDPGLYFSQGAYLRWAQMALNSIKEAHSGK